MRHRVRQKEYSKEWDFVQSIEIIAIAIFAIEVFAIEIIAIKV